MAEIVQLLRPDVLLLNEFDHDPAAAALTLFRRRYLASPQFGREPLDYPYALAVESNTGLLSPVDLDGDGMCSLPNDALGYGLFPGQYAFAVLSVYPLLSDRLRSLRRFLWRDMPNSRLPHAHYPPAALPALRLSSKNHIDLPLALPDGPLHLLACHPTPPTFGVAGVNAARNHDELRLFADYLGPDGGYIRDDQGHAGGLPADARFVLLGDLNADPQHGESLPGAVDQLLRHPRVHPAAAAGTLVPRSAGGAALGRPTASAGFGSGLRVDYVLPARRLAVLGGGVFWPPPDTLLHRLVAADLSSDHRLVWLDLEL